MEEGHFPGAKRTKGLAVREESGDVGPLYRASWERGSGRSDV